MVGGRLGQRRARLRRVLRSWCGQDLVAQKRGLWGPPNRAATQGDFGHGGLPLATPHIGWSSRTDSDLMNDGRREGCPRAGGWQHFKEKRARGGWQHFLESVAHPSSQSTTPSARARLMRSPGADDHGELKLRKRASPARFLRCAWSAATEPVLIGSFFGCLRWANDAFRSENLQMMCLQRIQHALVIKEEVATRTRN